MSIVPLHPIYSQNIIISQHVFYKYTTWYWSLHTAQILASLLGISMVKNIFPFHTKM